MYTYVYTHTHLYISSFAFNKNSLPLSYLPIYILLFYQNVSPCIYLFISSIYPTISLCMFLSLPLCTILYSSLVLWFHVHLYLILPLIFYQFFYLSLYLSDSMPMFVSFNITLTGYPSHRLHVQSYVKGCDGNFGL